MTENQKVVIVVGAGRSGTSTITRGLSALGIELGDNLKPGSAKNPKGFFEDLDILKNKSGYKHLLWTYNNW